MLFLIRLTKPTRLTETKKYTKFIVCSWTGSSCKHENALFMRNTKSSCSRRQSAGMGGGGEEVIIATTKNIIYEININAS